MTCGAEMTTKNKARQRKARLDPNRPGKLLPSEHQIQAAYFDLVHLYMPNSKLIYAVPNGANKSPAQRMKFKREGLTAGVFDVDIKFACGGYHGMCIEFKSNSKFGYSPEQKLFAQQLGEQGYYFEIHHDAQIAWAQTDAYLRGLIVRSSAPVA